jgi:hypothetical protein
LQRVVTLDGLQRVGHELTHQVAHLAEAAQTAGHVLAVLRNHRPVELRVGTVEVGHVELGVDEQLVVPLRPQRLRDEIGVARRRAAPRLDAVRKALLLGGLEDLERLGRREVEDHSAVRAGLLGQLDRDRVGVLNRDVLGVQLDRDPGRVGDDLRARGDVAGSRHVRLGERDLVDVLPDHRLRSAVRAVARAHVHG